MAFDLTDAREILADPFVKTAMRRELTRIAQHNREADRYSGVAPAGMRPDPIAPKTVAEIIEEGLAAKASQRRFDADPRGRFLTALKELEKLTFYGPADKARSAYYRGFADVNAPPSVGEIAVALNALNPLAGHAAQAAREALAELLLELHRKAA